MASADKLHRTRFPLKGLMFGILSTCAIALGSAWIAWTLFGKLQGLVANELRLRELCGRVVHLDEVLTMSARMAAATGDARWEARYRKHEPELAHVLHEIVHHSPEVVSVLASKTDAANEALVKLETEAFQLVRAGRTSDASALLSSNDYETQKGIYATRMNEAMTMIIDRASRLVESVRTSLYRALIVLAIVFIGFVVSWIRIAQHLRAYVRDQRANARWLNDMNANLESMVEQRTAMLTKANQDLVSEMDRRAKAELELLQAQKLESVGRLAAGVAHEINTPIQFVSDSVHFTRAAVADLFRVIEAYDQLHRAAIDGGAVDQLAARVELAKDDADLAYLLDNVPNALERSLDGLDRVATIVRSMKQFAHPDQKEMTSVNLNAAVTSTLEIARNEYKYVADLEIVLGDIPPVRCHAGEINQVILNIVVNAAHAIAELKRDQRGSIKVTTVRDDADVVVSISDTGAGIPEAIREHVFDPFFTTKEIGQGTGQGLAIARSVVVDKHGGTLTFETEVGKGTTFAIRLPIAGRIADAGSSSPDATPGVTAPPPNDAARVA
ncbi:MAG: sensor histidine kinase [Kofleriaceae bacterium]